MRIFQFVSYSSDSHYIKTLGKAFYDDQLDVCYGTLFETGKTKPVWMKDETKYICLNVRSRSDFPRAIWQLASFLRREKIDILQTHLYEASLVGMIAAKFARTPIRILTRHHLDQNHQIGNRMSLAIDRWEARTVDEIVVLSNAVKDFMTSVEGINADKITVIHQGFDFDTFSATNDDAQRIRREFGLKDRDFVIATIGNFTSTKGHRFLISAAKGLLEQIPDLKLMFIGDGGDIDSVRNQIDNAHLNEKVIFAGFRSDVNACMKAANLVVHPSLSEAFCQVLIETMSVGTPIISTDVGGAKEVITDGVNGILIPPADVEAIKSAILYLYKNRDDAKKIALAGQQSVRNTFTVDKMVEKQIAVYERLFNKIDA